MIDTLAAIHFLHLATAILWAGGTVMWVFAIVPALSRLDPDQIEGIYSRIRPFASAYLNLTGILLIATGIARLYWGGGVTRWSDLGTSYGIHGVSALVVLIGLAILESRFQTRIAAVLSEPGDAVAGLRRLQRIVAAITAIGLLLILALMTKLGLGYY